MLAANVASFLSNFSSRPIMALLNILSMMIGLLMAALVIACIFYVIASRTSVWIRWKAVRLSSMPSILPLQGIKSTWRPCTMADCWSHYVYTTALRHCTWHHPGCLSSACQEVLMNMMSMMLLSPKSCLIVFTIVDCRL